MKRYILTFLLLLPVCSFASSGDLYFTDGPNKGQNVLDSSIGYYEMCFTGNPYAVRNKTLKLLDSDIEKGEPYVRVDKKSDSLVISYVDTKCMDDSLDATAGSCRVEWLAPRCN